MCGFVGFTVNKAGSTEAIIKDMSDRIKHRGPDEESYYTDESVALGFRRLSIIDLSTGSQPIFNEDGSLVLVYNGEVYNFQELREDLVAKGHIFKTKTDSEVLIHGYEEYGKEFLTSLRGMFAFVIWDKKKNMLFGARDIFGIKPFYYYKDGDNFLFASEIKAFLSHPGFKKELNEKWLPSYLTFEYIPNENTLFQNVYKLLSGQYFFYDLGSKKLDIGRYYEIKYHIDNTRDEEHWVEEIEDEFQKSVVTHMISDVEVGCFLSSGVDSSYVVTEVNKNTGNIKTFSVGYDEEKYSELPYAQEFSKSIGINNISNKISAEDFFGSCSKIQYYMDEPLSNPAAVPLYFLAKNASRYVKVVLSGEGADELFGGYNFYSDALIFGKYEKIPFPLRRTAGKMARLLPDMKGKRFLIRGGQRIGERFIRNNYVFNAKELNGILKNKVSFDPGQLTSDLFEKVKNEDEITQVQYADMHTWLLYDILQKADKMSMANSLELRVPFLDKRVLNTALSIPSQYRVGKENTKIALRRAALRQLPPKTANRVKLGFPVPLNDWLKQDKYYNMVREKFSGETAAKFFDTQAILGLLESHRSGKPYMRRIWSVFTFLNWYEEFFVKNGN